jgi:hypothetical protein
MPSPRTRSRQRQIEWRASVLRLTPIMERAGRRLSKAQLAQSGATPTAWQGWVDALAAEVRAKAAAPKSFNADLSLEERLGYEWSSKVHEVGRCLEYMMGLIRSNIGMNEGAETLASMALVQGAIAKLAKELHNGGTKHGDEDWEEQEYRVHRALHALNPRFDEIGLRRVRALRIAEWYCANIEILDDAEVEESIEELRRVDRSEGLLFDKDEDERNRNWFRAELPMMKALLARSSLAEVDGAFADLDPLVVLEELAEARSGLKGGKSDTGEGKTGAARALARLALMCGALEYVPREGEAFDDATERARKNLHTTRARLREESRSLFLASETKPDDDITR